MVHVVTEPDNSRGPGPNDPLTVDLGLRTDALEVSISNRGDAPVDVLWNKASLVDTEDKTYPVVHSGADRSWAVPDLPGDVSRIPPHTTLNDFIIPTRSVGFDAAEGWIVEPLLPVECGPIRCIGYHELVGKTVRLNLTVQANGAERVFEWTLRITEAVKSMRGGRPYESNPH